MNWADNHRGSSFKRTLDYVLHDKDARTAERVGVVEILNLAEDADHAWAEMKATHEASPELKRRAGVKNYTTKCAKPVFHYSLSWHPDDNPDPAHMIDQAKLTLRILGLQEHQAVIVQHTDRSHPHVHVVVSLVHPEQGRTHALSHYKLKLDRWAHYYEVAREIRSPNRASRHMKQAKTFDERKIEIVRVMRERKAELKKKHQAARAERNGQKDSLWQKFRDDREAIFDSAQAALDDLWKRKPTERHLEPKGPRFRAKESELKIWAKVMKMNAQDHSGHTRRAPPYAIRPHLRPEFRAALTRIAEVKHKTAASFTLAKLDQRREGLDVMLPVRNTPEARRYARAARQSRKNRSEDIRKTRDVDLKARAARYHGDKATIDKRHASEIRAEKVETARFNEGVDRLWQDLGREFGLNKREVPDWLVKRQTEDRRTLDAATGHVSKAFAAHSAAPIKEAPAAPVDEKVQRGVDAIVAEGVQGRTVVPFQDIEGKVRNVQTIDSKGTVRMYKDAPTKDLFHRIDGGERIIVCGSYKSGQTIHALTGATVIVGASHHEMADVAKAIRGQNPDREMLIAPDRAEHFTEMGMPDLYRSLGERTANASGATLSAPEFGNERGQSWADLAKVKGEQAVVEQFQSAWRDRIETVAVAPAQTQTQEQTGSWRDAAQGPDWSAPVPAPTPGHGRTL